jgi:hypothetical protein
MEFFMRDNLSYFAGVMDGEGCFGMYYSKRLDRHYLTVDIYNSSTELLEWLSANFPGDYREIKAPSKKKHINWKSQYIWRSNNSDTLRLLKEICPLLIVKKSQCLLAIRFRETFIHRECPLSQETRDIRRSLYEQMLILNQRGIKVPPCLPSA